MQAREANFRELSESTNARVLWWSIGQVRASPVAPPVTPLSLTMHPLQAVVLVLTGVWQLRHLKSFFEAKKLV